MKKILLILFVTSGLVQCAPKVIPLKNTYEVKPFEAVSENNKDAVWDKIIDFFAQNGLSIKLIDRSSGLIVSEATQLTWTFEKAKGDLVNPAAWVVLNKVYDPVSRTLLKPSTITGEWNIRIKPTLENKTNINVNLVNLKYPGFFSNVSTAKQTKVISMFQPYSTGKFEEKIFNIIK